MSSVAPDIALEQVERNLRRIRGRMLLLALGAAAVVSALSFAGVGALLGVLLVPVLPILVGLLLRIGVVGVAVRATTTRTRRLLLRWFPRLLFLLCLWGWSAAPLPLVNLLALPLTAFLLINGTGAWVRWQLRRERDGEPIHPRERTLLLVLGAGAVAALLLLVATAVFVGWSIHYALSAVRGDLIAP